MQCGKQTSQAVECWQSAQKHLVVMVVMRWFGQVQFHVDEVRY
jgi:hypothetical protein